MNYNAIDRSLVAVEGFPRLIFEKFVKAIAKAIID